MPSGYTLQIGCTCSLQQSCTTVETALHSGELASHANEKPFPLWDTQSLMQSIGYPE